MIDAYAEVSLPVADATALQAPIAVDGVERGDAGPIGVRDVELLDAVASDAAPVDAADPGDAGLIAEAPPRRPRDASTTNDTSGVQPAEKQHRVRVLASDGPVHVRGGGQRGLAPWSSTPLPDGESLALHVTGGTSPLVAVVRVRNRKGGLTASIGAPPGEVHKVDCAGRAPGETPIFGVAVGAGGVACRLEASDGRTMSFVLLDVAE